MLPVPSEIVAPLWLNLTDKSLLRIAKLVVSILNTARAMRHLLGYFTGHTADTPVDTPCLYANSDVHTIPAGFSEICRCYFPEVSVMVTTATAINLS